MAMEHHSPLFYTVESGNAYGDRDVVTWTASSALTQDRGVGGRPLLLRLGDKRSAFNVKKEKPSF
jgi:hypothetical protein